MVFPKSFKQLRHMISESELKLWQQILFWEAQESDITQQQVISKMKFNWITMKKSIDED